MIIRSRSRFIKYLLLLACLGSFIVGLQAFIQMEYGKLIQTPRLLEDFKSTEVTKLPLLRKKYTIDYARIRSGKIIETSLITLPQLDLYSVSLIKNPLVIPNSPRESLKYTRPYVFFRSYSLYILFPLVFPEKTDGFLIIKKISP